ncbi:MAG TPA: amino acid decarboxylase [Bacillota bacterium]|nr:amino acid decarboxylase [Bacillota bacterium]
MLPIEQDGNRSIIDVRELILNGVHPRNQIIEYVRNCPEGTVVEIHLPHPAPPLVGALESLGLMCVMNELEPGHFRVLTVKR